MIEMKGLVLRGSVLRSLLLLANIGVAFYIMPFLIHSLGNRWYGMWTLVATFMGYYGYLDFGLSVSIQRFLAGAIGRRDDEEVSRLFTTSLWLFLALGAIAFLITVVLAAFGPVFFKDPVEISTFRSVILVLGINVAFTFAMTPVNGLMTGHLRFDVASTIQLGKLAFRTALVVYFISAGYSIVALSVITLFADVGANLLKVIYVRRIFPAVSVARRFYAKQRLPELFGYGAKTFVNQIADLLRFQLDSLVIATFINLSAVTIFNIAGQLVFYFRDLIVALMGLLAPVFARYQAADDHAASQKAYYFTSKLAAIVGILIGGAVIVFGRQFIRLWMGDDYIAAYELTVILIVPTILYVSQTPAVGLIYGYGAVGPLAKVSIIEAVANLVLSVILVRHYGLIGVALGTAIPLTFFSVFLLVLASRLAAGTILRYLRYVGPVFLLGGLLQVASWFVVQHVDIAGYLDMMLLFLAIYPAQLVIISLLLFSSHELRLIKETSLRALGVG